MWFMWLFAVIIPIGVIHAVMTGEIGTGTHLHRVLRFEEKPVGFVVLIAALCLMEFVLVTVLMRIRHEERAAGSKRRRRRRDGS